LHNFLVNSNQFIQLFRAIKVNSILLSPTAEGAEQRRRLRLCEAYILPDIALRENTIALKAGKMHGRYRFARQQPSGSANSMRRDFQTIGIAMIKPGAAARLLDQEGLFSSPRLRIGLV
jgi:hypothetical protein